MYRSDVKKEFEDGEITDSDHEQENNTIDQQRINTAKQIKPLKKFFTNSDSESDIEGICSVDEDDGICKITKVNSARNEPPKNKFSIWSSVMHDELLSNELSSWSGVNKFIDSDRNVESYAIDLKKIPRYRKRQREESNSMDESSEEKNLVDLETFGVSEVADCQKVVLPSRKIAKICRSNPKIDQVNKSHHKEMLPINVRVFQLDSKTDDVVTELLTTLHEPTQMREIFTLVVTTIGVERTYKLLRATEDVEGAGGVMVVKGHRRRTPGGVFLHLLKSQTTKEEQGKIFLQEKNDKQDRKKKKKLMIEEKSKRLAAMVSSQARKSENMNANTDDNELFDASNDITDIELDFI